MVLKGTDRGWEVLKVLLEIVLINFEKFEKLVNYSEENVDESNDEVFFGDWILYLYIWREIKPL